MATISDTAQRQRWEKEIAAAPARPEPPTTVSGVPIEPLYTPESLNGFDYDADLGYPGQYPFTRGVHASMYRSRLWTMRQFAGFGTPRQTNARFQFLLAKGQTGLSTAFDLPTLMGLDSDDPRALGEVGRLGVAVDTLEDVAELFAGIDLARVSVSMTINAPAAVVMAFFLANAQDQGVSWSELRGTIQNDILKEFHAQNEFVFPPEPHVRLVEPGLHQRLSHPRGRLDGGAGIGLHPGRRLPLRGYLPGPWHGSGFVRPASELLLQRS
jgi:methylmalonyl-CoA mutase N-terminal domain/subunit